MRIGLLSDIHANLPALESALLLLAAEGCDVVVNLGDAITIGPFPSETIQLLQANNIASIAGNHEDDLILGFSPAMESRMGTGERAHYLWTFEQLSPADRLFIREMPHKLEIVPGVLCVHHYLADGRIADDWREVDRPNLEAAFGTGYELVTLGHTHRVLELMEKQPAFVNPGSTGLHHTDGPGVGIVDFIPRTPPQFSVVPVSYDPHSVLSELKTRRVPDYEFVTETFFPGL